MLRAAGVYAVVSWFLIQVLASAARLTALPSWSVRAALALSFAGLPVALGVTWVLRGRGEPVGSDPNRHPTRDRGTTHPRPSGRGQQEPAEGDSGSGRPLPFRLPRMETVLLAALALVGIALWGYRTRSGVPGSGSVAVLPFENVTGDPDQDYFSQGVSDEIRSALASIPGLEVASRTSSFRLAVSGAGAKEIAERLGVSSVLEGSVQRAEDRVRVTVSLVDARSDKQLWSESYDQRLSVDNIFAVEAEIAGAVTRALRGTLGGDATLRGRAPTSLAAHDLYLLGLYHWNRRTGDELLQAAEFFREAVRQDPEYALAHAGLANTYLLLPLYAGTPADTAMPRARAAASRALALDSTLAEAHAALAFVRTTYDWDFQQAVEGFEKALSLDPSYATGREWYGVLLDALGRFDEALEELERARSLDPMSAIINAVLGNHLIFVGRYDDAVRQLERTLQLQPDLPLALQFLAEAHLLEGRPDEALVALRRMATATGTDPGAWERVVGGITDPDQRDLAIRTLTEMGHRGTISPFVRAQYLVLVGAQQEAFAALSQAVEVRDFLLFQADADPVFDRIQDRASFEAVLARMGLR
ncbi:MAG TPA: tetratricopeptide repeat protein [Longimicrobiales bacterium]|nr:tetratricopeptide repeat protein [Longimicrobiales bacterium]